jgi:hypothetical protein
METSQETEEMKKSELQYKKMKNLKKRPRKRAKKAVSIVPRWNPSCHDGTHRGTMRICFKNKIQTNLLSLNP